MVIFLAIFFCTNVYIGSYVPVCQMVSASQNINTLSFWLNEFFWIGATHASSFSPAKQVVTDFSLAQFGAVLQSFAKKVTLADYLSYCLKLIKQIEFIIPPCLLRLDICHFMNMMAKWKCWQQKRVKHFY